MNVLKKILDFYINCSIHVALSVFALVRITDYMFGIKEDSAVLIFAFFGTIVGYNFVKYDALARIQKRQMKPQLKGIALVSLISLFLTAYGFMHLQWFTQIIGIVFLLLTMLYTLPFFPNKKNARNWAGIKIYIVALCWVGVTLVLPIVNAGLPLTSDFYLKCVQRFILVFVLILIFEIIDLMQDDPHLKTVPQQIGVAFTKRLGYVLLFVFCLLELFNVNTRDSIAIASLDCTLQCVIALVVGLFLAFANPYRSKYYTSFWVESIPIMLWLLMSLKL